jgi:hypothetical protein
VCATDNCQGSGTSTSTGSHVDRHERVISRWATWSGCERDEARGLLSVHSPVLENLDRFDDATLDAAAATVHARLGRLPLTAWAEDARRRQTTESPTAPDPRKDAIVEALITRAQREGVIDSHTHAAAIAMQRLRSRAQQISLRGRLKQQRHWRKPPVRTRLSVPSVYADLPEFLLSQILQNDGIFSLDKFGAVYITQKKGWQRDREERIYVDGVCSVVDDVADLFFAQSPEGGRVRITSGEICVVRDDRMIGWLALTEDNLR